jgi:hypothetical protein
VEDGIRTAFLEAGERCHLFTHLSHPYPDGSSLYTTLIFRLAPDPHETLRTWRLAKEAASRAIVAGGGTISHHHGIGLDHRAYRAREESPRHGGLRSLLGALDPEGLMNRASCWMDGGARIWETKPLVPWPVDVLVAAGSPSGVALEVARCGLRTCSGE